MLLQLCNTSKHLNFFVLEGLFLQWTLGKFVEERLGFWHTVEVPQTAVVISAAGVGAVFSGKGVSF